VLDRLEVRLRTPSASPPPETPWQSKTPSNTHEFGSQSKLVSSSFTWSPVTAQIGFSQLVKGAELMLHQNALLAARNNELEEQLAEITKRKTRKRKRIQHGGVMEYGIAVQIAAEAYVVAPRSTIGCDSENQERAPPALRHCGMCGITGHNTCTCKKDSAASSDSDSTLEYIETLLGGDGIETA
jgi:hypothetical protein